MSSARCGLAAGGLVLSLVAISACGSASGGGDSPGSKITVSAQQCDIVGNVQPPGPPAPVTVLVVDNTASGPVGAGILPASVTSELQKNQAKNGSLVILGVNGTGANPLLVKQVALDPAPGRSSANADKARAVAISCVSLWIKAAAAAMPTSPGSDILGAVDEAIRRAPASIIVMSDGLNNVDPLDLNKIGFAAEPASVVSSLQATDSIDHTGLNTPLLWADLAVTAKPLPGVVRSSLKALWATILQTAGLAVTFAPEDAHAGTAPANAPADVVRLPGIHTSSVGCHTIFTVPTDLLFRPGDAHLAASPAALDGVRAELNQPGTSAVISGHTAAYGSTKYRDDLSVARAKAVAAALEAGGIPEANLTVVGYGSTQPAENEFHGGLHDLAAAAANRRVVIDVRHEGCSS
jgi:outer membrane protein OmpA-like peptidoglycan-associated protein